MKIILLKDIAKIGKRYETKEVADGFAVNSLIPQRLAIPATPEAVKKVAIEIAREVGERKVQEELTIKTLDSLNQKKVEYIGKTNEKGHLFAGLHAKEIAALVGLKPEHIMLDKPIKEVGEHSIRVKIGEKSVVFTLIVCGQRSSE